LLNLPFFINVGLNEFTRTGALVGVSVAVAISVGSCVGRAVVGADEMVGAGLTVGETVGKKVGRVVGVSVGDSVLGALVGLRVVGPKVGAELGSPVVGPMVGETVGTSIAGLELGAPDTEGAPVVGDTVGAFGSAVGTDDGVPVGIANKGHVSSSAATRHSPLHAPPTKQPEFAPSLKRRGPPLGQRKVASVSGLIKFILAVKSDWLSTKMTKSPLPPWKQDSVMVRKDRKSTRIGA
jgi:hypothetical protein